MVVRWLERNGSSGNELLIPEIFLHSCRVHPLLVTLRPAVINVGVFIKSDDTTREWTGREREREREWESERERVRERVRESESERERVREREFYFCVSVDRGISQIKHQLDATLCRFYYCRVTLHVSGVKRPSSGILKNWHGGHWYMCYRCR